MDSGDSRRAAPPRLSGPRLAQALRESFDLDVGDQSPLGGEVDQNVKVTTRTGVHYFVRVTLADLGSAEIQWQNSLLLHLAETVPDIPLPRLVTTPGGAVQVPVIEHGQSYVVRVMTWISGRIMAEVDRHPKPLLRELGQVAGRMSVGLSSLAAPTKGGTHDWDMRRARQVVDDSLAYVSDEARARDVRTIMAWFDAIEPSLRDLPHSVVHQDLNDANVLVDADRDGVLHVSGIVDVGDALYSIRATEVAIAAGYAMVREDDPLAAAAEVVAGFHSVLPLTAEEIMTIFPLAAARLCMNAVTWNRRVGESGSPYGRSRMAHTWPTIERLASMTPDVAEAMFRTACSLPAKAEQRDVQDVIAVLRPGPASGHVLLDLSVGSELFDDLDWTDSEAVTVSVSRVLGDRSTHVGHTRHLKPSLLWAAQRQPGVQEPATVQLGVGLLLAAGHPVPSPLEGVVESAAGPDHPLVLVHTVDDTTFRTCWWGLDSDLEVGRVVAAQQVLGTAASTDTERGLDPVVQVQIVTSAELAAWPPPRRIRPQDVALWAQLSPDPSPLLGIATPAGHEPLEVDEILAVRDRLIARSQRSYYRAPMNLVRGRDVWFYDENALGYLDSLNNVTHVGHAEPRVTAAATRQMRRLNTNSRFVYEQIATYADKLVATLPDPLEVVFLVCSGSEANDLALRIARQVTGREHIVNIDGAYHGNTGVVTGISPNRYKGPGGTGAPATTHEVAIPDRYRGAYGYDDARAGHRYAKDASLVIDRITSDGRPPAAFIAESLMGSAGNIVFPDDYLAGAFAAARRVGALCISDEVQVGVGRLGPWWGFELQGVVPDIVTMGKPLGNGHPIAAVVTTREIADAFDTGMKYFNTFGGNPVSCAIGEAVLDIVEGDGLRQNAVDVGAYFLSSLQELQGRHQIIGDVRGRGLYLGVELVLDRDTKDPASAQAFAVTELMKERGVIAFPNGVHDNVLKIKPPMTFTRSHVDLYVDALDSVLSLPDLSVGAPEGETT